MDCVAVSTFFLLRRTHLFVHRVDHQNSLKFLQVDFFVKCITSHNCAGNLTDIKKSYLKIKEDSITAINCLLENSSEPFKVNI